MQALLVRKGSLVFIITLTEGSKGNHSPWQGVRGTESPDVTLAMSSGVTRAAGNMAAFAAPAAQAIVSAPISL